MAPETVISPVRAQARMSQPGAPTSRADSADVMKMPEPIIAPMTSMVASSTPMSRSSAPAFAALGVGSVPAVVMALFSILSLEELRDIGDRLAEGLPSPVGQGRVHGQGKLVDQERRGFLFRLAVGAD